MSDTHREFSNKGPAFSLRAFAIHWGVEERTIRRHAKLQKIPGLFKSGERLKIRRCRASSDYGKMMADKKSVAPSRATYKASNPQFIPQENVIDGTSDDPNDPHRKALSAILELDRAKTSNADYDPEVWKLLGQRITFESYPERYRLMSEAASLAARGELPTQAKIAKALGISRRTFIRRFPDMNREAINYMVSVVLGVEGRNPAERPAKPKNTMNRDK
jgi:DNA-binding transcriptional MocR family regulator